MLALGSKSTFEDCPRRVKFAAGVSASPMLKEIGPAVVSSEVVTLPKGDRLGIEFVLARTKTVNVCVAILFELPLSFTVTVTVEVPATAPAVKLKTAVVDPLV